MPSGEARGRTWIAVDVDLFDHPKIAGADGVTIERQIASYLALIAYSRRHLTDGIVRDDAATTTIQRALGIDQESANKALGILRASTLLKRRKGAYIIPDYADWQQTAAKINAESKRQSAAGKASARKRRLTTSGSTSGSTTGSTSGSTEKSKSKRTTVTPGKEEGSRAHEPGKPANRNGGGKIPNGLHRILPDGIHLTNRQAETVTAAWEHDTTTMRQQLSALDTADNPTAVLVTIAKRLAPSADAPPPTDPLVAATAYAERMRATGMPENDIRLDITETWPALTPDQIDGILHPATSTTDQEAPR